MAWLQAAVFLSVWQMRSLRYLGFPKIIFQERGFKPGRLVQSVTPRHHYSKKNRKPEVRELTYFAPGIVVRDAVQPTVAQIDQRICCHQRASLQGRLGVWTMGDLTPLPAHSNLFPTVTLSVGWAQRRKSCQLRRIMVFKFCEMPLSGRAQVSGTSYAE